MSIQNPKVDGNIYTWGNGTLRFDTPELVTATWGKGTCKWLNELTAEIYFAGYYHKLTFNSEYNSYTSIRKGDLNKHSGSLLSKNDTNSNTTTYYTKYGLITLYTNEMYIGDSFNKNKYWDEDTLLKLKEYINPDKNILEIGGHCGTSTVVYSSFLNPGKICYVYEPQKNMYNLLLQNVVQNKLDTKVLHRQLS